MLIAHLSWVPRLQAANIRARHYGAPGQLTLDDLGPLWQRCSSCCQQCGRQETLELDHIIAFIEGGTNYPDNIQLLCESCHARKSGLEASRHRHRVPQTKKAPVTFHLDHAILAKLDAERKALGMSRSAWVQYTLGVILSQKGS